MSHPDRIESLIEARIRAAQENGEFDDLPGAGKPLPHQNEPYDENWWIKSFLRREGNTAEAARPAKPDARPSGLDNSGLDNLGR